jgi:hypothetical protein
MKQMKRNFLAAIVVAVTAGVVLGAAGEARCSGCSAVDCSFSTQCGVRCECVKLNGKIRGQCVEKW